MNKKIIAILLLVVLGCGVVFADSETLTPFLLNFFVGFGIGSYCQGDMTGGVIGTVGETVPVVIVAFATTKYFTSLDTDADVATFNAEFNSYIIKIVVSAAVLFGTRVFECIRPFSYAKKHTSVAIADSIGVQNVSFSSIPVLNKENSMGFELGCKIDF